MDNLLISPKMLSTLKIEQWRRFSVPVFCYEFSYSIGWQETRTYKVERQRYNSDFHRIETFYEDRPYSESGVHTGTHSVQVLACNNIPAIVKQSCLKRSIGPIVKFDSYEYNQYSEKIRNTIQEQGGGNGEGRLSKLDYKIEKDIESTWTNEGLSKARKEVGYDASIHLERAFIMYKSVVTCVCHMEGNNDFPSTLNIVAYGIHHSQQYKNVIIYSGLQPDKKAKSYEEKIERLEKNISAAYHNSHYGCWYLGSTCISFYIGIIKAWNKGSWFLFALGIILWLIAMWIIDTKDTHINEKEAEAIRKDLKSIKSEYYRMIKTYEKQKLPIAQELYRWEWQKTVPGYYDLNRDEPIPKESGNNFKREAFHRALKDLPDINI